MYRSAFVGPVTRWIVDELKLGLSQKTFQKALLKELTECTWYCPVTDSMVISEFYHANRITGIDQRPAFWPMQEFGTPALLKKYMQRKGLKRLVLMEDFVGSGEQTEAKVEWAVKNLSCPVLFVPLIICPAGLDRFRVLEGKLKRLKVEPVLYLDQSDFICEPGKNPDPFLEQMSILADSIHPKVSGTPDISCGPLGFGKTGGPVVLFSNTPDNSLPLIHHHCRSNAKWNALFPRVSREVK